MEDEAVLDRGAAFVKHICDEEEVEGELGDKYLAELSKCPGHQFSFLNPLCKFQPYFTSFCTTVRIPKNQSLLIRRFVRVHGCVHSRRCVRFPRMETKLPLWLLKGSLTDHQGVNDIILKTQFKKKNMVKWKV